jgi:hypothetical protein
MSPKASEKVKEKAKKRESKRQRKEQKHRANREQKFTKVVKKSNEYAKHIRHAYPIQEIVPLKISEKMTLRQAQEIAGLLSDESNLEAGFYHNAEAPGKPPVTPIVVEHPGSMNPEPIAKIIKKLGIKLGHDHTHPEGQEIFSLSDIIYEGYYDPAKPVEMSVTTPGQNTIYTMRTPRTLNRKEKKKLEQEIQQAKKVEKEDIETLHKFEQPRKLLSREKATPHQKRMFREALDLRKMIGSLPAEERDIAVKTISPDMYQLIYDYELGHVDYDEKRGYISYFEVPSENHSIREKYWNLHSEEGNLIKKIMHELGARRAKIDPKKPFKDSEKEAQKAIKQLLNDEQKEKELLEKMTKPRD